MRLSPRFVDFNKQLLFGEIGAATGTPVFPLIAARFTADPAIISFSAVVGGMVAGSVFWLIVKTRDERKRGAVTLWHMAGQIAWFSPAAFILGLLVYQPTLFFMARHLIQSGTMVIVSVISSQALAFALFVIAMNLYRLALHRITGELI